jgi:hypothetical protein
MTSPSSSSILEVWFHRHNGVDLVGGASSVEFALPVESGAIGTLSTIRLKDIREAARAQNSRSIGKYDSTEIILLHYNNRDVAPDNLSDHCLNPGQFYDVNVHGGSFNQPIIFRIVPEENMSYLAASSATTAALSCSPEATTAAISTGSIMQQPPVTTLPFPLSNPSTGATAEMDDASVATSTGSTNGTPSEKIVVHCGPGHATDLGNEAYARAIQRHQPAFLHGRLTRNRAKCKAIVDQIMERFEFVNSKYGHVIKHSAAVAKVKLQLSYERDTPVPGTKQALDPTKRPSIVAAHKKLPSARQKQCTTGSSSGIGKRDHRRGRDKILVQCGPGHRFDSGNVQYVKVLHRHRIDYLHAVDVQDTAKCQSIIGQVLALFEFLDRDGHLLSAAAARKKVRKALHDRNQLLYFY